VIEILENLIAKNGLVVAFLFVGITLYIANWLSRKVVNNKIPGVAMAIIAALVLAWFGGEKGVAEWPMFAGMALLGGSMFRDFAIVSTAMGVKFSELRKAGLAGVLSLVVGVTVTFFIGGGIGYLMGYTDAKSFTTIGAGACTYIVGPITGAAIGASSDLIAISIATGVMKTVFVTVVTPIIAKRIGLDNPLTAMVFGGMIGTTSGVAAGLAATDPKLVPYGAMTATFYTGLGVLVCPSIFYLLIVAVLG
jgi:malonate transporter MadM subunit